MAERRRSLITNEERAAFYNLASGEERQAFVELFWDRRDATPKTLNNEYKDTHYERMLYANHHFRVGSTLGWRAPRGRIYVIYGPPDEIEDIENKVGIPERGAVVPLEPPCDNISRQGGCYEVWRYHNIAGVNHPVTINFADVCEDGELIPLVDRADAERLSRPPAPKYKDPCGRDYVPTTLPNGITVD